MGQCLMNGAAAKWFLTLYKTQIRVGLQDIRLHLLPTVSSISCVRVIIIGLLPSCLLFTFVLPLAGIHTFKNKTSMPHSQ